MKFINQFVSIIFIYLFATNALGAESEVKLLLPPTAEEIAEEEAKEQAADLTDAIIENIDVSDEDTELTEPVESPEEPETTAPVEEEGIWLDQFQVILNSLQSLPQHVPGLAGRNWIFLVEQRGSMLISHLEDSVMILVSIFEV